MRHLLVLSAAVLVGGCGGSTATNSDGPPARTAAADAAASAARTVEIRGFDFGAALTVRRGTKVTWVNRDRAPHTATGAGFDTGILRQGRRGSFTFTRPGSYRYVCALHPFMRGIVVVR